MLTYIKTHLFYVIVIALGLLFGHIWLQEHDARLAADALVKQNAISIADLKAQIANTTSAANAKVVTVQKVVAAAITPAQVVAAIPALSDVPLNARVSPGEPGTVTVDAAALVQELGQCKETAIQYGACQVNSLAKDKIIADDELTIKTLKKPHSFFQKIGNGLKIALIAISVVEGVRIVEGKP